MKKEEGNAKEPKKERERRIEMREKGIKAENARAEERKNSKNKKNEESTKKNPGNQMAKPKAPVLNSQTAAKPPIKKTTASSIANVTPTETPLRTMTSSSKVKRSSSSQRKPKAEEVAINEETKQSGGVPIQKCSCSKKEAEVRSQLKFAQKEVSNLKERNQKLSKELEEVSEALKNFQKNEMGAENPRRLLLLKSLLLKKTREADRLTQMLKDYELVRTEILSLLDHLYLKFSSIESLSGSIDSFRSYFNSRFQEAIIRANQSNSESLSFEFVKKSAKSGLGNGATRACLNFEERLFQKIEILDSLKLNEKQGSIASFPLKLCSEIGEVLRSDLKFIWDILFADHELSPLVSSEKLRSLHQSMRNFDQKELIINQEKVFEENQEIDVYHRLFSKMPCFCRVPDWHQERLASRKSNSLESLKENAMLAQLKMTETCFLIDKRLFWETRAETTAVLSKVKRAFDELKGRINQKIMGPLKKMEGSFEGKAESIEALEEVLSFVSHKESSKTRNGGCLETVMNGVLMILEDMEEVFLKEVFYKRE